MHNAMGHWYAPTCGCKDTAKDASEHVDETNDGICDVCGYSDADHEHTYAEEYTYDENGHWNVANCGHDLTTEAEKHTLNKAGFCVCGYFVAPKIETLAQALEIAELQGVLVKTGTSNLGIYNENEGILSTTDVFYEFTDDYFHAFYSNDPREDVYVGVKENGDVFAVVVPRNGNPIYVDEEAFEDYFNGPKFNNYFMGDYSITAYGVVDYINAMYEFAKENKVNIFEEKVDGNKFSFTFDQYTGYYYNIVTVEFTLDETGYYIDEVNIYNERYTESYTYLAYYDENGDPVYNTIVYFVVETDEETGDFVSLTLTEDAVQDFTSTLVINQSTETKENPYNPSDVLVESFKVVDKDGKEIADTIKIKAGGGEDSVYFFFKDVLPTTAILELIKPTIVAKNDKGEVVEWKVDSYYNPEDQSLQVYSYAAGTYTIEVTIGDAIVTKTLVVELKDPTSFGAGVVVDGMTEEKTNVNMFAGNSIDIESVVGSYEKGDYTAAITSDNAANATLTLNDGIYTFTTTTVGTYEITLTSSVVSTLTATLTVEVKEVPAIEDILTGYYEANTYWDSTYSLTFGENNTVVVAGDNGSGDYTYAYDTETKALTFTYVSGATFEELGIDSIQLNSNYELVMSTSFGHNFVFSVVKLPISTTGEHTISVNYYGTAVKFQFATAGTLTITVNTDGAVIAPEYTTTYTANVYANELVTVTFFGPSQGDNDVNITVAFEEASDEEETTATGGTLIVVDDMKTNGDITGTYTYTINGDGSYSIYLNDEPCATFGFMADPGGYYYATVPASVRPMQLVDAEGNYVQELNGSCYIVDGETTYYTFTFTPSTGDSSEG